MERQTMKIINTTPYKLYSPDIVAGNGCYLFDKYGKKYIDFESGVWCCVLGHNNAKINSAMHKQMSKISHSGYGYSCEIVEEAAEMLLNSLDMKNGKCIFLSSGSEAVEFGVQIARKLTGKTLLLRLKNHYLSAYGVSSGEYGWVDLDLSDKVEIPVEDIGAFVFEPGNASGTVSIPQQETISQIAEKIKKHDGLIVIDEVTTGIGRTGKMFGFNHYDISPDIVACGKGLGNGYPVSAVAMTMETADKLDNSGFIYAQSHQNDPLGCAVVKEVLSEILCDSYVERSFVIGEYFKKSLEKLAESHQCISDVRGIGLMLAIEFKRKENFSIQSLHKELFDSGFIVGIKAAANLLRFYPPLIIEKEMIDELVSSLDKILE